MLDKMEIKLEKLCKWLRANSTDITFWGILIGMCLVTAIASLWSSSSGHDHTVYEVALLIMGIFSLVGIILLAMSPLVLAGISFKNWYSSLGRHQRIYKIMHPLKVRKRSSKK